MNASAAVNPMDRYVDPASALLSVEESARTARSLRAWPATLHIAMATRVVEDARQWAERWQVSGMFDVLSSDSDVTSFDGRDSIATETWGAVSADVSRAPLWWATSMNGVSVPPQRLLFLAMFDESGTSTADDRMADELVTQAWQDWCGCLTKLFEPGVGPARDCPLSPKACPVLDGALLVRLSWLGGELRLIVGGDLVESWVAANRDVAAHATRRPRAAVAERVSLLSALDTQSVALRVELARVTMDVGALIALQVGDVLCTGHLLASPLSVRAAMDAEPSPSGALCGGYLGARDGRRAVELTELSQRR